MSNETSGDIADLAAAPLDGRYRILSPLGSGGMADVYLARDESLGRLVAVKVLKEGLAADAEFVERFRIEAQAAASLNHPAIVAVYDRGKAGAMPYIVMEYVDGESVKQRVRRLGRPSSDEAAATALAVLDALRAAHERRIVHRDVTSANVLVDGAGRVKVADFGIARMGASALTRTGAMLGTSSYLSPEQAQGLPADERSDLYSLGVVLYEMLTGRLPFTGESDLAVALQHVSASPPDPRSLTPDLPEAYAAVVAKALSKQPRDRYQTADEFAAAVRSARDGGHAAPAAPGPPSEAPAATLVAADAATQVAADGLTRPADAATHLMARPVAPSRVRRHLWRWVVLAAVVTFAVTGAWAVYALVLAPGATVPGLTGRTRSEAVTDVHKAGLKPVLHEMWTDRYDAGVVARQRPRAGADVEDGARVEVWVSRGPLHIPSPDLTRMRSAAATSLLEGESLTARRRKAATRNVPKGEIYRQEPAAGVTVTRGDTVTFWVSSGPPLATVPDVVDLSSGDARVALEAEGFVVSTDFVAGWGVYPGHVVEQDPVAGSRLRKGDEVVIRVAVF